jgi:hypothetical protein
MLSLAKRNITPPGGYRYIDPDTERSFEAPSLSVLVQQVKKHRVANELEVPENIEAVIEDWICRHLPAGLCKDASGRISTQGMFRHTAESCIRQTSKLRTIMRQQNRNSVSVEVAETRAIVCAACAYNFPMAGCMSCRGIKDIIENMRNGKKTSSDMLLQVCGFNGVLNHVQVFIDDQTLIESSGQTKYPDNCWKPDQIKGARHEDGNRRTGIERRHGNKSSSKNKLPTRRKNVAFNRVRSRRVKGRCCGRSRKAEA